MASRSDPQTPRFVPGATALYAQLASVLRSHILSGEWADGAVLPSIDELCLSYGLGRVTVRQALQKLAEEGLVSSQRGRRTFVTHSQDGDPSIPLFSSIASIEQRLPNYGVQVLSRGREAELPRGRWQIGHEEGAYIRIRKRDQEAGQPYSLTTVYIAEAIYKRFPKGAENTQKLAQLLLKYAPRIGAARERITVEPADFEAASVLGYPMAAPVARAERVFCDDMDRVIYYGLSFYRGDRFGLERDLREYLKQRT